ncbi:DUF3556 domain-containing protein [Paraliomyxa miuraensis]|uniref:DUF3556 domain-containing protein n=1 Tax=Paraliomyxa miuraensis TaxID=376150 RepID=UPI0022539965|nr:DUF3556 domain-containing protein [Paraliomyxa miuraensis]MCX4240815.1 DUF3556 domain-containing protein [Paraliomyxa miuraensis]
MGLLDPVPTPYDPLEWDAKPFPEKARMVCRAWALQGYGTPIAAYGLYALKICAYVGVWIVLCGTTEGLGDPWTIGQWWSHPIAFQKAILWSMMFEVLGLGCGSGPLTGRYWPPVGGALYFLRPGTTKLPRWPGLPGLGGRTRGLLDVALYLALLVALGRALVAPALGPSELWPIAILVPLCGVADRTLFLAARAEHYWVTVLCFVLAPAVAGTATWMAGAKWVALALWFWAGVSKLNHHFPAVVCVMTSNSPVLRWPWLRRRMYRRYPDDLRPNRFAERLAHGGTALELGVPLVLLLGSLLGSLHGGGDVTFVGLLLMVLLHAHITSSVPMGVPLEWNVMVVYGGFVLFGAHADVSLLAVGSWPLVAILVGMLLLVPLLGNLRPDAVSFLPSMRYYAGNWACSIWLFRGDAYVKLDRLTKSAPWLFEQLDRFYDRATAVGLVGKVIAFRLMHLHGRALPLLLPRAVERPEDYLWADGELIAGLALGWNFGDGHLHDERLLLSLQAQCGFDPGELRCIFVESQPLLRSSLHWRIWDAATGKLDEGHVEVARLRELQPWPEDDPPKDDLPTDAA